MPSKAAVNPQQIARAFGFILLGFALGRAYQRHAGTSALQRLREQLHTANGLTATALRQRMESADAKHAQ